MKKITELTPNKRNPRKISKRKQEALKKAIAQFGDLGSIIFNRRSKQLVGGHQRVAVIPKDAPIHIEKHYETPTFTGTVAEGYVLVNGERFKYREVMWDDTTERAAMIAANAQGGEWDEDLLKEELDFLNDAGFDMDLTGMDFDMESPVESLEKPGQKQEPSYSAPFSADTPDKEETDEQYVRNTPKTEEQIDVERPSNVKYEPKGFDEVEEQQGVKGQRFVIIIDCKDKESKAELKEKLMPLIEEAGAKVF